MAQEMPSVFVVFFDQWKTVKFYQKYHDDRARKAHAHSSMLRPKKNTIKLNFLGEKYPQSHLPLLRS
jgi:hypothetical protein